MVKSQLGVENNVLSAVNVLKNIFKVWRRANKFWPLGIGDLLFRIPGIQMFTIFKVFWNIN